MIKTIILLVFLGLFTANAYENCKGQVNNSPLLNITAEFVSKTTHGTLYKMEEGNNIVYIANVTGTPYQMGFAHGGMLKDQIQQNINGMNKYIRNQIIDTAVDSLGITKIVAEGLSPYLMKLWNFLLGLNYDVAKPFIPQRYIDEIQGMSDASSIPFEDIMNMNMIPELIKAACTIVGAWKQATYDTDMFTVRALDWDYDAPINRNPSIIVYHSVEKDSYPFANIGYVGLVGALTAVGAQGVSVQEKVWLPKNEENIPTTYKGKPWTFMLRDLAQFGTTLDSMVDNLYQTHRTCRIHVGLGSGMSKEFEAANYSWEVLEFFNDKNYTDYNVDHPQLDGVVFIDKHSQPSHDPCTGSILQENWGKLDWEILYRDLCGLARTGDSQICITDVYHRVIYLSYSQYKTNTYAYERSPMYIDLNKFFGTNYL